VDLFLHYICAADVLIDLVVLLEVLVAHYVVVAAERLDDIRLLVVMHDDRL